MTQDTRKDRRVKIVSLNVRYKSATVDEFIDNHALDVSRGGIYIKTSNPFPPTTLLKFEIRLASDQAVIAGVGRVVWKRDASQATPDRPAGMGVKFIKIVDDASRAVIERLTSSRADAGRAFESEPEAPTRSSSRPPPPANPPPPGASRGPARPVPVGKATIVGLGAQRPSPAPPPPGPGAPVGLRPASIAPAPGMFPKAYSDASSIAKNEQTVMKQAAELLEEALREAGGSLDEVGNNPLFAGPAESTAPASPRPSASPASAPISTRTSPPSPSFAAPASEADAGQAAAALVPGTARLPRSERPPPVSSREELTGRTSRRPEPPITPSVEASDTGGRARRGGIVAGVGLAVIAAAATAGVAYRDRLAHLLAPEMAPTQPAGATSPAPAAWPPSSGAATGAPSASTERASPLAHADALSAAGAASAGVADAGLSALADASPPLAPTSPRAVPVSVKPSPVAVGAAVLRPRPPPVRLASPAPPPPTATATSEATASETTPPQPSAAPAVTPTSAADAGASAPPAASVSSSSTTPRASPRAKSDDNPY
jgi:uncharacterized protein (TIGR02266 family)